MKGAKREKEEGQKEKISLEFQLYFVCVFAWLLCYEQCLPGIFMNSRLSQTKCWNKPKSVWSWPVVFFFGFFFGLFFFYLSRRIGSLAADRTRVQFPRGLGKQACYFARSRAEESRRSDIESLLFAETIPFLLFAHASPHLLSEDSRSFSIFLKFVLILFTLFTPTYLMPYNRRIVIWSYNCLIRIIIICNLIPYNGVNKWL